MSTWSMEPQVCHENIYTHTYVTKKYTHARAHTHIPNMEPQVRHRNAVTCMRIVGRWDTHTHICTHTHIPNVEHGATGMLRKHCNMHAYGGTHTHIYTKCGV